MYDAIVVGARCAGSPTAMLLARKGLSVLLIDKAAFPSDTISTHIIWPSGTSRLKRWGLLDRLADTGCPLNSKMTFDVGPFALSGSHVPYQGISDCYAPRRTVLDNMLVEAAADAGVEVRTGCSVEEVLMDDEQAVGVRCRSANGVRVDEKARIVIGADGRNSVVAQVVGAEKYNVKPNLACWYYAYWSGAASDGIEFYMRPERAIGSIPTNDGLVCIAVAAPFRDYEKCRSDVEASYMSSLELTPAILERTKKGKRETRFFGLGEVPNFFRKPFGPGWALVGDAGYHKDPIGAQGISDAFRDAEILAEAIYDGFSEKRALSHALAEYEQKRNDEVAAMYDFNCQLASLDPPPPEMQQMFGALRGNQVQTDRFFGVLSGTVPIPEFFSPDNMRSIMAGIL